MTHQDAARGVEDGVRGELASPLLAGDALDALETFLPPAQAPAYDAYEGAAASLDFYDLENNHLMSTYLETLEAIEESHGAAGAARRRLRGAERRLAFRRRLDDLFASNATEHGVADAKRARGAAAKARSSSLRAFQVAEGASAQAGSVLRQRAAHDPRLRTVAYWTSIGFDTGEIREALNGAHLSAVARTNARPSNHQRVPDFDGEVLPERLLVAPQPLPAGGPRQKVLKVYTTEVQGSTEAGDVPNILVVDPLEERAATRPRGYPFRIRVGWSDEGPGQGLAPSVGRVSLDDMYLSPIDAPEAAVDPALLTPAQASQRRTSYARLAQWKFLGDQGAAYVPFDESHTGKWMLVLAYSFYDDQGQLQPQQRHSLPLTIMTRTELAAHYAALDAAQRPDADRHAALTRFHDDAMLTMAALAPRNAAPRANQPRLSLVNPTDQAADALRANPSATVPYSVDYHVPTNGGVVRDERAAYEWTLVSLRPDTLRPNAPRLGTLLAGGAAVSTSLGEGVRLADTRAFVNLPPTLGRAPGTYALTATRYHVHADGRRGEAQDSASLFLVVHDELDAARAAQVDYALRRLRVAAQSGDVRPLHAGFSLNLAGYETRARHGGELDAQDPRNQHNQRRIPLELWYTDTDIDVGGEQRRGICVWDLGGGVGAGAAFSGQGETLDLAIKDYLDKRQLPAGTLWVSPVTPDHAEDQATAARARFATNPNGYESKGPSTWDGIGQALGLVAAVSGVAVVASRLLAPLVPQARYAVPVFTVVSMASAGASAAIQVGVETQKYQPDGMAMGLNIANLILVLSGAGMWAKAGLTREGHALFSLSAEQRLAIGLEAGDHLVMAADYAHQFAALDADNTQDRDLKLVSFLLNVLAGVGLAVVSRLAPGARPNTDRTAADDNAVGLAERPHLAGPEPTAAQLLPEAARAGFSDMLPNGMRTTTMSSFVNVDNGNMIHEAVGGAVFEQTPWGVKHYHRLVDQYDTADPLRPVRTDVLLLGDDEGAVFRFERSESDGQAFARLVPIGDDELGAYTWQANQLICGARRGHADTLFVVRSDGKKYLISAEAHAAVADQTGFDDEYLAGIVVNGDTPMLLSAGSEASMLEDGTLIDFSGAVYKVEDVGSDGTCYFVNWARGEAFTLHVDGRFVRCNTDGFAFPNQRDLVIFDQHVLRVGGGEMPVVYDHLDVPVSRIRVDAQGNATKIDWGSGDAGAVFARPGAFEYEDRVAGQVQADGSVVAGRVLGVEPIFVPADRDAPAQRLVPKEGDDGLLESRFAAANEPPIQGVLPFGYQQLLHRGLEYQVFPTFDGSLFVGIAHGQDAKLFVQRGEQWSVDTSPGTRLLGFSEQGGGLEFEVVYENGTLYEIFDASPVGTGRQLTCRVMIDMPMAARGRALLPAAFDFERIYVPGQYHFFMEDGGVPHRTSRGQLEEGLTRALAMPTEQPAPVSEIEVRLLPQGAEISVEAGQLVHIIACAPVPPSPRPGYRYPSYDEIAAAFRALPASAAQHTRAIVFEAETDNAAFLPFEGILKLGLSREGDMPSRLRSVILHESLGHGTQGGRGAYGLRMILRAAELDNQPMPRTYPMGPHEMWTTSLEAWDTALRRGPDELARFEAERPYMSRLIRAILGGQQADHTWLVMRMRAGLFSIIPLIYALEPAAGEEGAPGDEAPGDGGQGDGGQPRH